MDTEKDGSFASNIQQRFLEFLGGLLPLLTLVPLVVNNIDKISGLSLHNSLRIFNCLYFLLPVLFVLIWLFLYGKKMYTYPDGPVGEKEKRPLYQILWPGNPVYIQKEQARLVTMATYSYLFFALLTFILYDWEWFGYIYLILTIACYIAAACFLIFSIRRYLSVKQLIAQEVQEVDEERQQERLDKLRSTLLQYLFFIAVLLSALSFILINIARQKKDLHPFLSEQMHISSGVELCDTLEKIVFKTDSFQKKLEVNQVQADVGNGGRPCNHIAIQQSMNFINDRINVLNNLFYNLYDNLGKQGDTTVFNISIGMGNFNTHYKAIDSAITSLYDHCKDSSGSYIQLTITRIRHLTSIGNNIRFLYEQRTKKVWSKILYSIQFKGLLLFFLVLWILFNGWFLSTVADSYRQYRYKEQNTRILPVGRPHSARYEIVEKKEYAPFPIILVFKRGITVIILLIIPFYKPIDPETINLDKPFLNFSVQNLYRGDYETPPGPWAPPIDTLRKLPVVSLHTDTVINRIDTVFTKKDTIKKDTTILHALRETDIIRLMQQLIKKDSPRITSAAARELKDTLSQIYKLSHEIDSLSKNNSRHR